MLCGGDGSENFNNGSFCLKFSAFDSVAKEKSWPSLLHNANSSQVRVWLDGVTPRDNKSRFSLELQAVGDTQPMTRVNVLLSIDDEYTPSIFKVSQWVSLVNTTSPVLSYAQWKPVTYRKASPLFEDATPCHHSTPVTIAQRPPSGLVLAYFKGEPHTTGLNITFSIAGDPFYNTTNYLSWTVLIGLGSPRGLVLSSGCCHHDRGAWNPPADHPGGLGLCVCTQKMATAAGLPTNQLRQFKIHVL
ncbi:hypothetical protein UPYG_G00338160 [Umbra pygmaea]|uniref:Uncharacterized protein n=1 Tax=Umbra pygmaea TaxID=75934 RepID=A0ABD0W0M0_UMBPY